MLRYLIDRPGQLVTKAAFLDAVWTDVTVSASMPSISVAELRKVFSDDARQPSIIETVHGRGHRFIAAITPPAISVAPLKSQPPTSAPPSLSVGREAELARAGEGDQPGRFAEVALRIRIGARGVNSDGGRWGRKAQANRR